MPGRRTAGAVRSSRKPRPRPAGARNGSRRPTAAARRNRRSSIRVGWLAAGGAVAIVGLAVVIAVVFWGPELVNRAEARDSILGTAPHAAVEGPGIPAAGSAGTAPTAVTDRVDRAWSAATALRLGIPERAMVAYAGAALAVAETQPGCGIAWNTLAALGSVESGHGTIFGGALDDAGRAVPPIVGPALTGTEFDAVTDTDRGAFDGDARWDRAVGPMQFIPSTWQRWGADGNGDGVADPQQIDDAALAAAHYLCHGGRDLRIETDWIAAIGSYNGAASYLQKVVHAADTFAAN
ncbi:lytic transglycosylase domain-containing protein [Plantibacter flavus]|uniref:lytic transglycosylase domain-containing protein n=1 Tax=Plantibacter flavus TaxID=150123 RepID=UPI003399216B